MIEEDSIKPTLHSFSILLGCLRKNKEYERSILLFKELKYQEIEIDSPLMKFVILKLKFK
jgi:pentatricopeptide repeat protein